MVKSGTHGQVCCISVSSSYYIATFGVNHSLGKRKKEIRKEKKKRSYSVQVMLKTGTEYRVPLHSEFPILMAIGKGNTGSLCQKWAHFQFAKLVWTMDLLLEGLCAYVLEIVIFLVFVFYHLFHCYPELC